MLTTLSSIRCCGHIVHAHSPHKNTMTVWVRKGGPVQLAVLFSSCAITNHICTDKIAQYMCIGNGSEEGA